MSPNWSPTTARQTKSIIDCHVVPNLGALQLQTLRTEDIDAFYGELRQSGGREGQPLSPGTVHRVHVVLHRALAQALRWEWLWVNPASSASPPSCEPAPIYPPSPEEVVRLLSHVSAINPEFHTFLSLAVSTGARRSQIGALRWGDIDLERGSGRIPSSALGCQRGSGVAADEDRPNLSSQSRRELPCGAHWAL